MEYNTPWVNFVEKARNGRPTDRFLVGDTSPLTPYKVSQEGRALLFDNIGIKTSINYQHVERRASFRYNISILPVMDCNK